MNNRKIADRICYLRAGQAGLTRRHALQESASRHKLTHFDEYDREALSYGAAWRERLKELEAQVQQ